MRARPLRLCRARVCMGRGNAALTTEFSSHDFIAVDWGTTSFRAYLARGATVLDEVVGPHGILSVEAGGHAVLLSGLVNRWREGRKLPIVMSGMIGSRQGWREAPYAPCPTSARDLAARLFVWEEGDLGMIRLIPGVLRQDGVIPDVMRGEETQIVGALALMGVEDGVFIMPGTHSKRVEVRKGRIMGFSSFMTGEVFAALKSHTILGRLMQEGKASGVGFAKGVEVARALEGPGALLNAIFGARTLCLTDRLPPAELSDYLSGLLIAAELRQSFDGAAGPGILIGSGELVSRYLAAADQLGISLIAAPPAIVVAGQAVILAMSEKGRDAVI